MLKLMVATVVSSLLCLSPAFANETFNLSAQEFSRNLSAMKENGHFKSYVHSCEIDAKNNAYSCLDALDGLALIYTAVDRKSHIHWLSVVCSSDNAENAAGIVAGLALSLNPKYVSSGTQSDFTTVMFKTLVFDIKSRINLVLADGRTNASGTNETVIRYEQFMEGKQMVTVTVVPQ